MIIPPLSWYQNLGMKGELWHPRTTTPLRKSIEPRRKELDIHGIALAGIIDKIEGIVREVEDVEAHYRDLKTIFESDSLEVLADLADYVEPVP